MEGKTTGYVGIHFSFHKVNYIKKRKELLGMSDDPYYSGNMGGTPPSPGIWEDTKTLFTLWLLLILSA